MSPAAPRDGIYVDLGFFKDVLIPPHGMPDPSYWHEEDEVGRRGAAGSVGCCWCWMWASPLGSAGSSLVLRHAASLFNPSPQLLPSPPPLCPQAWLWRVEGQELFFERGLPLRLKAQSVRFHAVPTLAEQQAQAEAGEPVVGTKQRPFVPMEVVGRADGDGLGMVHWYGGDGDEMAE